MSSCLRDVFTDKIIHRLSGGSDKNKCSFNDVEF